MEMKKLLPFACFGRSAKLPISPAKLTALTAMPCASKAASSKRTAVAARKKAAKQVSAARRTAKKDVAKAKGTVKRDVGAAKRKAATKTTKARKAVKKAAKA